MFIEALILVSIIVYVVYRQTRKPPDMPPGSFGLPIIGQLPPMNITVTEHFRRLKQKYGKIFTIKWGSRPIVALADPQIIKKALNHPDIQARPDFYTFGTMYKFENLGVILASHDVWKDNRRFLLHNLRNLGMGKSRLEDSIADEADMLVKYLDKNCLNEPTEIDWSVNVAVLNVIWQMLAGTRYEADDEKSIEYNKINSECAHIMQGPVFFFDVMPWLLKIIPTPLFYKLTNIDKLFQNRDNLHVLYKETVLEHEKTLDPENPRDVIDQFLIEKEAQKDNPNSPYRDDYLDIVTLMGDIFFAGSETTSSTLRWAVLYLAMDMEIQQKAHKYLDAVVPKDRLPSLEDRSQLAYIDAIMLDVLRLSSLVQNSIPHFTTKAVQLEGYNIPKDTVIMPCLELCHKDPAFWEKPNQLYPEHFLDSDGKLDSKKEAFMPFSIGRRQCLGESLARMELYLFASAILHRFTIEPPPGVEMEPMIDPTQKLLNIPLHFKVVLKRRI